MNKKITMKASHLIIIIFMVILIQFLFFYKNISINNSQKFYENQMEKRFEKDEYCRTTYRDIFDKKMEDKLFEEKSIKEYYSLEDIFFSPKKNSCFVKYEIRTYLNVNGEAIISTSKFLQEATSDKVWTQYEVSNDNNDQSYQFIEEENALRTESSQ